VTAFLQAETSSAVLLLGAAAAALVWANSPWQQSYETFWSTQVGIRFGSIAIESDLHAFVNEGLMSLFFLVVGLEVKREFLTGELRDPRAAVLPVVAAIGGMIVPALLFVALNAGGPGSKGWGIPMATDIAFALAVLTIAARSAPPSLKPFLLTLAIVDDIGAIVVIAIFYSSGVSVPSLLSAATLLALIVVLQRFDVRATIVYVALGVGVWVAFYESGVHPTIAGVILGLLTPTEPFQRPSAVSEEAIRTATSTVDRPDPPDADAPQWLRLAWLSREAVSPLARVEEALHPWTSHVIVPIFALANAGLVITSQTLRSAATSRVTWGVIVGLVLGKIAGIGGASALVVRSRIGRLPSGSTWRHLIGLAAVAGIGFTVSLFIAELAFGDGRIADDAKIGILAASALAGGLGFAIFRWAVPSGRRATSSDPVRAEGDR
jgi:NhaA family Na+:H+ antiporter